MRLRAIIFAFSVELAPVASLAEVTIGGPNYCKEFGCKKGHLFHDAPIVAPPWTSFDSTDPFVWGMDVCLGYFLTKDNSALSGGSLRPSDSRLYVTLDGKAGIHIFDYPYSPTKSFEESYGTFGCESHNWPRHVDTPARRASVERWIETRLTSESGWTGIVDWDLKGYAEDPVEFRNDQLQLTVKIANRNERVSKIETGNWKRSSVLRIKFSADYFGPPITYR